MSNHVWDDLFLDVTLAITTEGKLTPLESAAIAVQDGRIAWLGTMADLPGEARTLAKRVESLSGCLITPGLIDCHTHLVYAGSRAAEFERRLQGVSYETIAREGGGIQSTVKATREASEDALFEVSLMRAKSLVQSGVTTMEIKSGYGLDFDTEVKMLTVAKRIEEALNISVVRTFLGAHSLAPEYQGNADAYINVICDEWIPRIANEELAQAVDVFCETIAFSLKQTERVFEAASKHGLQIKCHSEQLSCSESAALAARYRALSVDHLEHVSEASIKAMAEAGTVAVLLPGAYYFLRETQCPPIALFRAYGVPIAIATDSNPGTSPTTHLPLMMNMACTAFRLTPEEAFLGVTTHAAKALNLKQDRGELRVGTRADLACWQTTHPRELSYRMGDVPLRFVMSAGKRV